MKNIVRVEPNGDFYIFENGKKLATGSLRGGKSLIFERGKAFVDSIDEPNVNKIFSQREAMINAHQATYENQPSWKVNSTQEEFDLSNKKVLKTQIKELREIHADMNHKLNHLERLLEK